MDEIKAKQQVVEKIKEAGKILVTVSDDPSVDALSAALGLALLLDKQEKYATAIFSGQTPPAIAFLEPEKTFDDTTDSLRDFIIALNKEKADHLRYKVEGDAVRIFITPYKTTINQDDLEFSQGDYNVELVIALGVDKQENLDKALENHGQILHDAAIVTLTSGDQTSDLGGVDWHDGNSSSLSEMVAGLAEALKEDKKKSLLDTQIATALLTGIVAETDRFSNEHTTSKVMTVAASLMAAGADQQLIATELQQARAIDSSEPEAVEESDDDESENSDSSIDDNGVMTIKKDPTSLNIAHEGETLAELDERVMGEEAAHEKIEEEIEAIEHEAEEEAEKRETEAIALAKPKINEEPTTVANAYAPDEDDDDEPTFGGVLNATADQAEEDARKSIEDDQNKTILSHSYIGDTSTVNTAAGLTGAPVGFPGTPQAAPGSFGVNDVPSSETVHSAYAFEGEEQADGTPTIAMGGERVIEPLSQTEPAPAPAPVFEQPPVVESAYAPAPEPAAPADLGLPLPPPIPDFSQGLAAAIPTTPSAYTDQPPVQPAQPAILGDILAPEPAPAPSYMEYETTNSTPAPGSAYAFDVPAPGPVIEPVESSEIANPPVAANPAQFQIPSQQ